MNKIPNIFYVKLKRVIKHDRNMWSLMHFSGDGKEKFLALRVFPRNGVQSCTTLAPTVNWLYVKSSNLDAVSHERRPAEAQEPACIFLLPRKDPNAGTHDCYLTPVASLNTFNFLKASTARRCAWKLKETFLEKIRKFDLNQRPLLLNSKETIDNSKCQKYWHLL